MQRIIILNFEEYNPRKDRKRHHWFRIDNTIPFSKKLDGLDADQKWLWVCFLALASFDQRDWIEYDIRYLNKHTGVSEKKIKTALLYFKSKSMISIIDSELVTDRLPDGDQAVPIGITTIQDNTLQTDNTKQYSTTTEARASAVTAYLFDDGFINSFISKVPIEVQNGWLGTYNEDADWIRHQLREAVTWIHGNPARAPKTNFAKFFSSWLSRSWEWKRKNNKGGKPFKIEDYIGAENAK